VTSQQFEAQVALLDRRLWSALPAHGVRAAERDNLLVVEAHAVEDVPQVQGALRAVGQAAVRGALVAIVVVHATGAPRDVRACPATMPSCSAAFPTKIHKHIRSKHVEKWNDG